MALQFGRLRTMGTRAGGFLLAGALAAALTPAVALAHWDYSNDTGLAIGDQQGNYPEGEWVTVDEANGTYVYKDYAHGDNAHYGTYSLYTELSVKGKVLTGINLYSGVDTFFGRWGAYSPHSNGWTISGYLPDGVSLNPAVTENEDGSITVQPVLKGADKYGYSVSGMYLESVTADALVEGAYAQQTTTTNRRTGQTTTKVESTSSFNVTADNASDYCAYDKDTGTVTLPALVKSATVADGAISYGDQVVNPTNLIRIVYKIGEYAPFTCYVMVDEQDEDADAYLEGIAQQKTSYAADMAVSGMGSTNRDRWTKTMLSEIGQRWISSWGKGLSDESLAAEGDNEKEVYALDTISGATKTSEPFTAALEQAFDNGYFTSVSDELELWVDRDSGDGYQITRDSYTDKTSATVDEDGHYVVKLDFFSEQASGAHGVVPNKLEVYALGDQVVGPQGMLDLERQTPSYEALYTASNSDISNSFENEYVKWDADSSTLTILDASVTHLRSVYTLGHADSRHSYSLADLAAATELNATAASFDVTDEESRNSLLEAWNALPTDARGFLGSEAYAQVVAAKKAAAQAEEDAKNAEEAKKAEANLANATVSLASSSVKYTGKAQKPAVTVKSKSGKTLKNGTDYTVSYSGNKAVGTAKVVVTGKGSYTGSKSATFKITKAAQPMKVSVKKHPTLKVAKVKKANQTVKASATFKVTKAQGTVTYKKASGNKKITVSKKGVITVKKGLKKGTYSVKVKATAKGNANYASGSKTVTVKVKVK